MAFDLNKMDDAPAEALIEVHSIDASIFCAIRYAPARLVEIEAQKGR